MTYYLDEKNAASTSNQGGSNDGSDKTTPTLYPHYNTKTVDSCPSVKIDEVLPQAATSTPPEGARVIGSKQNGTQKLVVKQYIDKIDPIPQRHRNNRLHNAGILLRKNFGLTGDTLVSVLSEINQTKCTPPLQESEVSAVARSVDKANVPLGDSGNTFVRNGRGFKKPSKPETRTEYTVSISTDAVHITDLLQKAVSIYPHCRANVPSGTTTIGQFLDDCKNGMYREQVETIRAEQDKDQRNELKKALPAITPNTNPQAQRTNIACEEAGRNGIAQLDLDSIQVDELSAAAKTIAALSYVFAVGLSASGTGLFILIAYEGTPDLKKLIAALQNDFKYEIDKSRSDLCGLRFASYDPDLVIKSGEVFPAVLTERTVTVSPSSTPIVSCGIEVLDNILAKIDPVDWARFETVGRNGEIKPPSERAYILRTIERILDVADGENTPIVKNSGSIHYFTGTHYKPVNETELTRFLIEAANQCGVPSDMAVYQTFVEKIFKQFLINTARHNSQVSEPDTPFINLKNGTLFFDKTGHRFEEHSPQRFIQYYLQFNYNPTATAPLWQKHLDRSLPIPEKQLYLTECLALPFYRGKIEKAPIFHGERDTGKSTTVNAYTALLGTENITSESLAALTQSNYHGDYARARLDGKLVNIASDISAKISDEGIAKTLISREPVSARHPNQRGFDMRNYARLIFAMNNLPPQFFTDSALTKRVAIITFDRQIKAEDIDTGFAEKIITDELPGILNWIIAGLERLLKTGRLDAPPCCINDLERLRTELDPLSTWLAEMGYYSGTSAFIAIKDAYWKFCEYCKENGNIAPSKKTFTKRLRDLRYVVEAPNNHVGVILRYTTSVPHSAGSPFFDNQSGNGQQVVCKIESFPDGSPIIPLSDTTNTRAGNEGNDISAKRFNCCESEYGCPVQTVTSPADTTALAAFIRQSNEVFTLEAILPYFNGDQTQVRAFLRNHIFDIQAVNGNQQIIDVLPKPKKYPRWKDILTET